MTKLVLFDIDGTILLTAGAGRRAIVAALARRSRAPTRSTGSGSTARPTPRSWPSCSRPPGDREPLERTRLEAVCRRYVRHLARELEAPTTRTTLMPGVGPLLDRLEAEPGVVLGLLTGNIAEGAALKLRSGGIDPARFRVGAFGSDAAHRPDLPAIAARRATPIFGREPPRLRGGHHRRHAGRHSLRLGHRGPRASPSRPDRTVSPIWPRAARTPSSRTCRRRSECWKPSWSDMHNEVELKAVLSDPVTARMRLLSVGAVVRFRGAMSDRRYDRNGRAHRPRRGAAPSDLSRSRWTYLGRDRLEGTGSPVARGVQGARRDRARRRRFRNRARRVSDGPGLRRRPPDRSVGRGLRARRHARTAGELPPDGRSRRSGGGAGGDRARHRRAGNPALGVHRGVADRIRAPLRGAPREARRSSQAAAARCILRTWAAL